jgi:hypothetical protein
VDAHADPTLHLVGPTTSAQGPLDGDRRLDGRGGLLEDPEELVGTGLDLTSACLGHGIPNEVPDVVQQACIPIAQPAEESCRALDVGEQEGHEAAGESCGLPGSGTDLALLPLGSKLAGDEADGHDAVLLGGVQQPFASALTIGVVVESDLVEPGKRVAHVRLVMDGQPSAPARVDIGECAVGELRPLAVPEFGHGMRINA